MSELALINSDLLSVVLVGSCWSRDSCFKSVDVSGTVAALITSKVFIFYYISMIIEMNLKWDKIYRV